MNSSFPNLFSPITLAGRQLKNRIAFPAVVTLYAREHLVTERWIDYYSERAKGGAAMLVTEGMSVHESSSPQPGIIALFDPRNDEALKRAADAVEQHDCRFLGQLWHVGRQALWNPVAAPLGVSDLPDALSWSVPHVMGIDDIKMLIDAFTQSAQRLQRCGFSGVELHGAHGYLIGQFLSPWSNKRTDEYGGDVEGRTRFTRELIASIRAACGPGFIVGLKMPGDEGVPGGIDPEESARIARHVAHTDAPDFFAFAQGNFSVSLENHVPDMNFAAAPFMSLQRELRGSVTGVPVMVFGRVTDAAHAEQLIQDGTGDLIGMGRALIADAALPNKAARGDADRVRPCVFSNVCWGEIHGGKAMACLHNPELGQKGEADWLPARARHAKRIVVVGAGVAGLQTAWVCAARGHRVTLIGSQKAGGKAAWEATLPGRGETEKVYAHQLRQARTHGVEMRLGNHADVATLKNLAPEVIILATGSSMRRPDGLEDVAGRAVSIIDYAKHSIAEGGAAVLFDQDHTQATYAVADQLAARHQHLIVVTPRTQLGRPVPYVNLIGIYRRLYQARVEIVYASFATRYEGNRVTLRNAFNGDERIIDGVALLAYATPRIANDTLARELRGSGIDIHLVGDCFAPRTMLAAIHEAHQLALTV